MKNGWFSTNASSNFKCPFPSAFGKILAFLAQPSTNGEKYALLSAGNVSVNHQQVVIQPTSKHIKCIFDTKSFHLVLPLTKHTKKDKYKFAFLTSVIIKRRTVSFPIIFSYFYSVERKALWTFVFLFIPNFSFLQRLFSGCKRSKDNS